MATFIGTSGDDIYNGGGAYDSLDGAGGDDSLSGGGGQDSIIGGTGADTLIGGAGDDFLASYMPDDNFYNYPFESSISLDIYSQRDSLVGGAGDDKIAAGYGDFVDGGDGDNYLYINFQGATSGVYADFSKLYTEGSITVGGALITHISEVPNIQGSEFDDYLRPFTDGFPFSVVHGNGGNDTVVADYYTWSLFGDAGNDTLDGSGSQYLSSIEGGDGDDVIYDSNQTSSGVYYGGAGKDRIYAAGLVYGGDGGDVVKTDYGSVTAYGQGGGDVLQGSVSQDRLYGGTGGDRLSGGDNADQLFSDGGADFDDGDGLDHGLEHDTLDGGAGNDILSVGYNDDVDGGAGVDSISMVWDLAAAGLTLTTGDITSGVFEFGAGTVRNVEKLNSLYLTDNNDVVTVSVQSGTITVDAEGGDDRLTGSGSAVHLIGGAGDDTLVAAAGGDRLDGGAGDDTFMINGAGETVNEQGGEGTDLVVSAITYTLTGNVENLSLVGLNISGGGNGLDNLMTGSDGKNGLTGLGGDDTLDGGVGNDKLDGGDDNDRLLGGSGDDAVKGGTGDDTLLGGDGADRLTGGSGLDVFLYQSIAETAGDVIADFHHKADHIDLSAIDAVAGGGDDPFAFIGDAAFGGHAGELRYEIGDGVTEVSADIDGDGVADFTLAIKGEHALAATDFVL